MNTLGGDMARGFFAELNYQSQQADKRRRQQQAAAYRAQAAAERQAEAARKAAERARAAAARASVADQKAAQKEAARLQVEAQLAEVASRNGDLANEYAEIDGLLAASLEVDDYVDLESLKITNVEHPPFEAGGLGVVEPALPALTYPPEPAFQPPAPLGALAGRKKKEAALEQAKAAHQQAVQRWQEQCQKMYTDYLAEQEKWKGREAVRVQKVAALRDVYDQECRDREARAQAHNEELAQLTNGLAFDVEDAIQEYVGIVLSNSAYPDSFPVSHSHKFDLATRELTLQVTVPEPSAVPSVKEYKYVKAKDEITATQLTAKAQKDRYASAVWQVAVRTLHEVFEADRVGKIHSIALSVGVDRVAPATGLPETIPLVIVAAERETFNAFDLTNVVPEATLAHLGAAMSKSPFDLTPAGAGRGVRAQGQ
jgi:restriction system protein